MSHHIDVLDRAIRHHQAIFMLKIPSILRRALDGLSHQGRVVRMNPLEDELDGGCRRAVVLEDAKRFVGPADLAGGGPPTEAPRMTEPLRFRQVRLAALQVPFGESPVHPRRQEVSQVISQAGRPEDGTDPKMINMVECLVDLKPASSWTRKVTKEQIIQEMDRALDAIPGIDPSFSQPIPVFSLRN